MAELSMQEALRAMQQKSIEEKKTKYRMLNRYAKKGQIVFTGSSLMEFFPIDELQQSLQLNRVIYNRGLAGATTADLLAAMEECVFELEPAKIFINIGSNDIGLAGYKLENLLAGYDKIMDMFQKRQPDCMVYAMAYYPVNSKDDYGLDKFQKDGLFQTRTNENLVLANEAVEAAANKHGFRFINANKGLTDSEGSLKKEFSIEGVHLWPNAYAVILDNLRSCL